MTDSADDTDAELCRRFFETRDENVFLLLWARAKQTAGGRGEQAVWRAFLEPFSERQLLLLYWDGLTRAGEALFERQHHSIYRYLRRYFHDPADADEVFQESWLDVLYRPDQHRDRVQVMSDAHFGNYLKTNAGFKALDYLKLRRREQPVSASPVPEDDPEEKVGVDPLQRFALDEPTTGIPATPEARVLAADEWRFVLAFVHQQTCKVRCPLLLHVLAGVELHHLALLLSIPTGTVKTYVYRLPRTLKALRAQDYGAIDATAVDLSPPDAGILIDLQQRAESRRLALQAHFSTLRQALAALSSKVADGIIEALNSEVDEAGRTRAARLHAAFAAAGVTVFDPALLGFLQRLYALDCEVREAVLWWDYCQWDIAELGPYVNATPAEFFKRWEAGATALLAPP